MFLVHIKSQDLVEILDTRSLFNPLHDSVIGRFHAGEELQDPEKFHKSELTFQSGEKLPECWTNSHYRDEKLHAA